MKMNISFNVVLRLSFAEDPLSIHLTPEGFVLEEIGCGDDFSENQIPDLIRWVRENFSNQLEYLDIHTVPDISGV